MFHPHSSLEDQPGNEPAPWSRDRLRLPDCEYILTLAVPLDAQPAPWGGGRGYFRTKASW
jgi:hypothetical protein